MSTISSELKFRALLLAVGLLLLALCYWLLAIGSWLLAFLLKPKILCKKSEYRQNQGPASLA